MAMPKTVTKVTKDGVTFTSNVDRVNYTLGELSRAALRDVGKLLRKRMKLKVPKDTKSLEKNIATRVVKKTETLEVGVYSRERAKKRGLDYAGYYAHIIEFGSRLLSARPFLRQTVTEEINTIREIEAKYLQAIEDEQKAKALIDESEEIADD